MLTQGRTGRTCVAASQATRVFCFFFAKHSTLGWHRESIFQVDRNISTGNTLTRRALLRGMLALGVAAPFAQCEVLNCPANPPEPTFLSPDDHQFLEELERANCLFFVEQAHPQTGLVRDRCNVRASASSTVASIAATGFGLTALCIGHQRGFIALSDASAQVLATLRFLWKNMPVHRGFFYHWADINTGERTWNSEVSSIDTALLLCGVLTCRQHFPDSEIRELAHLIFNRVDWTWLSEDTTLLPHGWTPEIGFLPYRWDYVQ